jgi:hypothetical protein
MKESITLGFESVKRQYRKLQHQHRATLTILQELKNVGPTKGDLFRTIPRSLRTKINEVLKNGN